MANRRPRTPRGTRYKFEGRTYADLEEWVKSSAGRKAMATAYQQRGPCPTRDALEYARAIPEFAKKGMTKGTGTLKRADMELKKRGVVTLERPGLAGDENRAQLSAHSRAIAMVFLERAEALLGPPVLGRIRPSRSDNDAIDFAADHLKVYPDLVELRDTYEREHAALVDLEGELDPILYARSSGPWFSCGKVGCALYQKVLEVTKALYPGIPEWPEKCPAGGWPHHYVDLEQLCRFIWMAVEEQERGGETQLFRGMHAAPIDGGKSWKVTPYEGDGQAVVVLGNEEACKSDLLKKGILRVIRDPDIIQLCHELHAVRQRVDKARLEFDDACRMLGHRLKEGELVRGVCRLGY